MSQPIPDFDTAAEQLRHFITETGHSPGEFLWVSSNDVIALGRRLLVRVPLSDENECSTREAYERGRDVGLGVCLDILCQLQGGYCCKVWFVQNEEESAYRNCSGLKLSIPCDLVEGEPIGAVTVWSTSKWMAKNPGGDLRNYVPGSEGR